MAVVRVLLVALPLTLLAIEGSAAAAVGGALDDASRLRAEGHYAEAIAAYRAVSARQGPLYLLANGRIDGAAREAAVTQLDWARSLAAHGHVDEGLELAGQVTEPAVRDAARRTQAQIALDAAQTAAAAGRDDDALRRLDQLAEDGPPADLAARGVAMRPAVLVGAARQQLAAGHAADAVADLDAALRLTHDASIAGPATALMPGALLAGGRERIAAGDPEEARTLLQRCTTDFGQTAEADQARSLLAAPQPVTGTMLRHDGSPAVRLLVRLSGGYRAVPGGYVTRGPYLSARTDGAGNFRFGEVPVGEPLVFEFYDGGWALIVDTSGHPAYPVDVQPLTPLDMSFVRLPA